MMTVLDELRSEHATILRVLAVIEDAVRDGGEPRFSEVYVGHVLDFVWYFIERNHHGKEERALFLRMREDPVLESLAHVLHEEHEQGAALVAALERAVDEDRDTAILRRKLLPYIDFLRDHIARENEMIFPAIENALEPASLAELESAFRAIEAEAFTSVDRASLLAALDLSLV